MLLFEGGLGLLVMAVWIFCIIDVITTPESEIRNLPKVVWVLLVIILVDIGAIAWLVAGRPWNSTGRRDAVGYRGNRSPSASKYPEYDRPGRYVAANPDDDEEFLAQLRARAAEQRKRARELNRSPEDEPPATGA